jgi:hypothetical protein
MKSLVVIALAASTLCAFASCDKRPAAKFRPGDKVRVKLTQEEGTVCLWTRFFREDQYFVTLPDSVYAFLPVRDREWQVACTAWFEARYGPYGYPTRSSHEEGPFYESDLERVR